MVAPSHRKDSMTATTHRFLALSLSIALLGGASTAGAQTLYVAFTQAGGFDTSQAWGVGSGKDLNSAIGAAHAECTKRTLSCGDEGYCALRPGLFSAWASNLKVAGGRGVSCNQPTEELARSKALAECGTIHLGGGPPCRVLWSGPSTGSRASTLDELREWVRTNFTQVVGRAPGENAVNDYVSQLQAWETRAPAQEGKDYLLKTVFPSLR